MLFFSQLTAQDLQYIDLVLAGDLMNPIWSFEVGVELEYEVRLAHNNAKAGVVLAQNGARRDLDTHVVVNAPGIIGSEIATTLRVENNDGTLVAQKAEFPVVEKQVTLTRISDDPLSENYNLFAALNENGAMRPMILSNVPEADLTGLPQDAIVLQDDPIRIRATICRPSQGEACTSGVTYDELDGQNSWVLDAIIPVRNIRFAFDIGINCTHPEYLSSCDEIIWDMWDNQMTDGRPTFVVPWRNKSLPNQNNYAHTEAKSWWGSKGSLSTKTAGNVLRVRLVGTTEFKNWKDELAMLELQFPGVFPVARQYGDKSLQDANGFYEIEEHVEAVAVGTDGSTALVSTGFLSSEELYEEVVETAHKRRIPGNLDTETYERPKAGNPYVNYSLFGESAVPADYIMNVRGRENSEQNPYQAVVYAQASFQEGSFWQVMGIDSTRREGEVSEFFFLDTPVQTRRAKAVQEYYDHKLYSDGGREVDCKPNGCPEYHTFPVPNDFVKGTLAANYGLSPANNTNCDDPCANLAYGNYGSVEDRFAFDNYLTFAESVRTKWNEILIREGILVEGEALSPKLNSGWRNPERNEAIGGVINSEHQWDQALDLGQPLASNIVLLPESHDLSVQTALDRYFDITDQNQAPKAWCMLAEAAWEAGGKSQTIVENKGRSGEQRFMYFWQENSVIDSNASTYDPNAETNFDLSTIYNSCVDSVRRRVIECLNSETNNAPPNDWEFEDFEICSPDHIHSATGGE